MALFLLKNSNAKTVVNSRNLIVQAASEADAKTFASTYFAGDSGWAGADATEITATTLDSAAALTGWTLKLSISGGAAQTVDPIEVSVTGDADDDLDDVAGKLVTALNAADDIANAAYSAPNLTVAGVDDGIGDATVLFFAYPPSGETDEDLSALLTGAGGITHEGLAAAALTLALVADTEAAPKVIAAI